jgi:hypothetical protein
LNEDIKAAFEKAAKEYDARADAAKQQRDQELTERQQFEAGYQQKRDEVILPSLRFVTTILESHGWTCKISDSAASTKFEVFRGNMRGPAQRAQTQVSMGTLVRGKSRSTRLRKLKWCPK